MLFANGGSFDANIDLNTLNPNDGFLLRNNNYEGFGSSISGAGDLNGDGFDDLVIGAPYADAGFDYMTGGNGDDELSGADGDDKLIHI